MLSNLKHPLTTGAGIWTILQTAFSVGVPTTKVGWIQWAASVGVATILGLAKDPGRDKK